MWTRFHSDGNVPTQNAASTASDLTIDSRDSIRLYYLPMCLYVDRKGPGKQQAEGKRVTPCQNKGQHSSYYNGRQIN